ncbi:WD40 repeat domain-containing serine/threonine protein kinase [Nonomuraea sp. NPDC050790]|uniref:WD40 repeat domain-containing serine/threonine protein kinase n=1 Tax=Nonomuraea sp. NPDC050790 TaxID=3364371 RepID=UPI00379012CC
MNPLGGTDPKKIGRYRLLGVLGEGGQGAVYLGEGPDGDQAAIKILHAGAALDPGARRRFFAEAEAARRVDIFCTAQVLDVGTHERRPYIVSEYIRGISLADHVRRRGPWTGSGFHRLAITTITALAAIHRAGVAHLDFKPGNVILGEEGPVVIDFGIAQVVDQTMIRSGAIGTPGYMAPEQISEEATGPASDVFGWAATMVYACAGHPAFPGSNVPSIINAILSRPPDLSGVPSSHAPLLARCLDKDPARRPGTDEIGRMLTGQAPMDRRRPAWRRPGTLVVAAAALTAVVVAVPLVRGLTETAAPGPSPFAAAPMATRLAKPAGLTYGEMYTLGQIEVGGRQIVVGGGFGGALATWDARTGLQVGEKMPVGDLIHKLALTRIGDEALALAASSDGTVTVWDLATCRRRGVLDNEDQVAMTAVAGATVAGKAVVVAAGSDHRLRMWDLSTERPVGGPFGGHTGRVQDLAVAEVNGRQVAISVSDDGTVRRWDLAAREQIGDPLWSGSGRVSAVATGELDGRPYAVSGHSDGRVIVWDLTTGRVHVGGRLSGEGEGVRAVAVVASRDRTLVAAGDLAGKVRLWDMRTGVERLPPLRGHRQINAVSLAFLTDRITVVTAGSEGTTQIWRLTP